MRKLIHWHYKEYLCFLFLTVLTAIALFEQGFEMYHYSDLRNFYQGLEKETLNFYMVFHLDMVFYYVINETFWGKGLWSVIVSILVQRAFFNWNLKDSFGRCYFVSLPFYKADYNKLFLVRDIITIVVTLSANAFYIQYRLRDYLTLNELQIPWLGNAIIGITILTGAYLLFLLGIYVVLESLFVNGILKMVGSLVMMGGLSFLFKRFYEVFEGNSLISSIYHFVNMTLAAGNCEVVRTGIQGQNIIYGHKLIDLPILYRGEQTFLTWDYEMSEDIFFEGSMCRLYDFANIQTFLTDSLLYLVVAILCTIMVICLVKRHEESREGFYHAGTPYVVMSLGTVILFFSYYEKSMTTMQILFGGMLSVSFLVLLCGLYVLSGKRNDEKGHRLSNKDT